MSQAGVTRVEMATYLERHGWERQERRPGAGTVWRDPLSSASWRTEMAYVLEKGRQGPKTR